MPRQDFMNDFGHTINRADKIQPALLSVAIVTGIAFGVTSGGTTRLLAFLAAGGFLVVMLASLGVLVPLQRGILRSAAQNVGEIESMQRRWFSGHIGRTVLSVVTFVLAAIAVSG